VRKALRLIVIGSLLSIFFLCSDQAGAQIDPWEFEVYPYATEGRGMIELETDNAVVANGHGEGGEGMAAGSFRSQGMWYNGNELTYGLTDRIDCLSDFGSACRPRLLVGRRQVPLPRQAV
jgi:hypothetical protein